MGIFSGEKRTMEHHAVDTIIGEKAKFKGELSSSGSVSINGEFEGKLKTEGELIIARGSKVSGNVQGGSVIVSGRVDGNITASQSLEITKTSRVHGDLTGGKIIIEDGSSYCGRVRVEAEEKDQVITEIVQDEPQAATL